MNEDISVYEPLAREALQAKPSFSILPDDLQFDLQRGISEMMPGLRAACHGNWNNICFIGTAIMIHGLREPYKGHEAITASLRERVKECVINPRRASTIVRGSLRDVISMVQIGVTTMVDLEAAKNLTRRG